MTLLWKNLVLSTAISVIGGGVAYANISDANSEEIEASTAQRIDTVVVTSTLTGQNAITSLPVMVLSGEELANRRLGGLGETLAGLPGVHLDNFGGGASRPVIRGQTVPRIEILSDGANLFDVSSVAPDHAITSEPLLLDGIEVLRGSAAARYGGNALNGAVNLIDSKIPKSLPEGGFSGGAEARYGLGDQEASMATRATASVGQFAFHLEGFNRSSENYSVPRDFGSDELGDSFSDGNGYSIGGSWIIPKGYIGAAYSRMDSEYGLPGHSHKNAVCHTHGTDLHCASHGAYEDPFGSSDAHTAKINLRADRYDIRADYEKLIPGIDHTRVRLSFTDYEHDEIDGPFIFTNYTNEVYDARLELTHAAIAGFSGTFGVQYTDGEFNGINVNDLHKEFPENGLGFDGPSYHLTENFGVFLNETRSFGAVDLDFAIRKDWREINVTIPEYRIQLSPELSDVYDDIFIPWYGENWRETIKNDNIELFKERHPAAKHEPLSASLGATWNVSDSYSIAASIAHSERAPNIRELYAYGNNLATNSYEVGLSQSSRASSRFPESTTDVMESTDSINLTFRKTRGSIQYEIGLFHQDIEDYIFARLIETDSETGTPHNYLLYVAADATFTGLDGQISYDLSSNGRATLFGDYVDAEMTKENDNLPRIPPSRLGARYEWNQGPVLTDIEFYHTFEQDSVASYETQTDGYNMLNATASYKFNADSDQSTELFIRATNLLDELAFIHTSFVKNQSPLRGRNIVFGLRTQF